MTRPISPRVRFRQINVAAVIQQIAGTEPPYPVYYFGRTIKFERPERPGKTYRWARDIDIS